MGSNDYSTLHGVKALLPQNTWGTSYDVLLTSLITRASRMIDSYYSREPGSFAVSEAAARYFDGSGDPKLWIGELAAAPSIVAVAETADIDDASGTGGTYTTWATSDYLLWPYNNLTMKRPVLRLDIDTMNGSKSVWYRFPKAVKITGYWGYATTTNTPEIISHACEVQSVRWFRRAQQTYADTGAITDLNQLRYVKALDPEVKLILDGGEFQWLL